MPRNKQTICSRHAECQNGGDGCWCLNPETCVRFLPTTGTNLADIKGKVELPPNVNWDMFSQMFSNWIDSLGYHFNGFISDATAELDQKHMSVSGETIVTEKTEFSIKVQNSSELKTDNDGATSEILKAAEEIVDTISKPKFDYNMKLRKRKSIPKEFMAKGTFENGGYRKSSPIGVQFRNMTLDEIRCPKCGQTNLVQYFNEIMMGIGTYYIGCDGCDWRSPKTLDGSDCGDNVAEFKEWLEAFYLLGAPKDRLDEDLTLEFYLEGEYRDKMREYISNRED